MCALYFRGAEMDVQGKTNLPTIACPECGVDTVARDDGVMCLDCVRATYDWRGPLEAHVRKHGLTLARCTGCDRVETSAPGAKRKRWEEAPRDSEQLLGVLLRRVKAQLLGKKALELVDGLSRGLRAGEPLALKDARLVWTEPHSRRLLLEADLAHASVVQRCRLEFVEERRRCDDCAGVARERRGRKMGGGGGSFGARVQVRTAGTGGASGARTLRSLEDAVRAIGRQPGGPAFLARRLPRGRGLDADFEDEQSALRFVDELRKAGKAPLRFVNRTRKLVTHDPKANTAEFQRTILLEVPPVSKFDLVLVPAARGPPELHLVLSVRREIHVARVGGKGEAFFNSEQFFRKPFSAVASADAMVDLRVCEAAAPLGSDTILVARHSGDEPAAVDAARLPEGAKRPGSVVRAYDLDSIPALDARGPRFVLVAPGKSEDAPDDSTHMSTVRSRKQKRKEKRDASSVASDATQRDFDDDEFQLLVSQPGTIPEDDVLDDERPAAELPAVEALRVDDDAWAAEEAAFFEGLS